MAAAPKVTTAIELPRLAIETIEIPIVGDSPLIVHKFSEKAKKQMLDKQMKKASVGKEAKDPWRDFVESMYWLDGMPDKPTEEDVTNGRFGFPAVGFKAAAVTACTSIGSITKVAARQAFHVEGEFIEIKGTPPSMREDIARVGMGTAGMARRVSLGRGKAWQAQQSAVFGPPFPFEVHHTWQSTEPRSFWAGLKAFGRMQNARWSYSSLTG